MESSSRRSEQAWELRGFPLRPAVLSLLFHVMLLLGLMPQFSATENRVPPANVLQGRLSPAPPAVGAPDRVLPHALASAAVARTQPLTRRAEDAAARSASVDVSISAAGPADAVPDLRDDPADAVPVLRSGSADAVPPAPTFSSGITPALRAFASSETALAAPSPPGQRQAETSGAGGERVPRHTPGPATAALAQEIDERGTHAAGLRQFRLALAVEARRFRRYPDAAERAGLTGTAEVRVTVDTGVSSRRVDLNRSSGHAPLDTAALEMLRQAAVRTVLPETLQGRNFVVVLPVVFETEK